jgi:nucleoside-diphosphate-sugar epimerase
MVNVLVTGGCGRIGAKLVQRLVKGGDNVTVIDPKQGNIAGVRYISAKITEVKVLEDIDVVYHLAARIDYKASKDQLREANVAPTAHLLNICKSCKQFILLSTTSVYNESSEAITESTSTDPYTNYGWSKLEAERLLRASGTPYTIIRSSQVYGPDFESGYATFLRLLQKGDMRVFGHGNNYIPLVHVNDLLDALLLVRMNEKAMNEVFNVDGDYQKTQNEFMELAAEMLEVEPPASHVPPALAKLRGILTGKNSFIIEYIDKLTKDRRISIDKIMKLGFRPKVSLEDGMFDVITAFRERGLIE